jgi:hypothetical protein
MAGPTLRRLVSGESSASPVGVANMSKSRNNLPLDAAVDHPEHASAIDCQIITLNRDRHQLLSFRLDEAGSGSLTNNLG